MNEIDQIKDLLFGHEKKALDAITRRLDTPESRTADVADVLPQSVRRSHARDASLAGAMEGPVTDSIRLAVRNNPKAIADSLFPVIGPAIRKAIAEALKGLVQSINATLDTRLSPSMRFKAWRAGVPLPEYIVQRSLLYHVEQVFLIHRETGMLIRHASDVAAAKDRDAVSAMFTAIQDFVKESFTQDESGALETADMGEYTLWAVHGPAAVLTCLIRGTPPRSLRNQLAEILERVHRDHCELLLDFSGDETGTAVLQADMEQCLQMERRATEEARAPAAPGIALWLVLALLVGVLVFFAGSRWKAANELNQYREALLAAPGIVPLEVALTDGVVSVTGMMDPLATMPLQEARDAGRLTLQMAPYQSLEPAIVERRVRNALAPPEATAISLEGSTLVVTGELTSAFRQRVQTLAPVLAGVDAVEFRQTLRSDDEILAAVREAAGQPDTVQMAVSGGVLSVAGTAPSAWKKTLSEALSNIAGLNGVRLEGLQVAELVQLRSLAREIQSMQILFGRNDEFAPGQGTALEALSSKLSVFVRTALAADLTPGIALVGFTDGFGESRINERVRLDRAAAVRDELMALGVDQRYLQVRSGPPATAEDAIDRSRRRVTVAVSATDDNGLDLAVAQQLP